MWNKEFLFREIDGLRLALFRIVFGFFATLEVLYFYKVHLIEDYLLGPKFLFNYHFLPLEPMGSFGLNLCLFAALIGAIGIMLGYRQKWSALLFFICFSYLFLLDKSYYNNHIYFIALVAFLLIFIPANRALSIRKTKNSGANQNWHLLTLQAQVAIVYFFGGLAKANSDWLVYHEPAKTLLAAHDIDSPFMVNFIVYGGLLFDLLIPFFLCLKRTRIAAFVLVICFNISNHFLFDDINIFPFFMLSASTIFLPLERIKFLKKYRNAIKTNNQLNSSKKVLIGLGIYFFIQCFLPLRHFLIDSNPDWTSEGQRFAWRMKIQTRALEEMEFQILDPNKKMIYPVTLNQHIHAYQEGQLYYYPKMVLDFAHYLAEYAKKNGVARPQVRAKIKVRFNGREGQYLFSPNLDLSKEKWNAFSHNEWINPLAE